MSWNKSACEQCEVSNCTCKDCSWNYTPKANGLECACRKPYNRKCKKDLEKFICIKDMELSLRQYACLKKAGINSNIELNQYSKEDLRKVRNLTIDKYAELKK